MATRVTVEIGIQELIMFEAKLWTIRLTFPPIGRWVCGTFPLNGHTNVAVLSKIRTQLDQSFVASYGRSNTERLDRLEELGFHI